jgi:hypothetical protein
VQTNRHHQLKGKLKGFWEYEVDGGARVRYKRGPDDRVVVLVFYAGSAPRPTPIDRCSRGTVAKIHTFASDDDPAVEAARRVLPFPRASGRLRMVSRWLGRRLYEGVVVVKWRSVVRVVLLSLLLVLERHSCLYGSPQDQAAQYAESESTQGNNVITYWY